MNVSIMNVRIPLKKGTIRQITQNRQRVRTCNSLKTQVPNKYEWTAGVFWGVEEDQFLCHLNQLTVQWTDVWKFGERKGPQERWGRELMARQMQYTPAAPGKKLGLWEHPCLFLKPGPCTSPNHLPCLTWGERPHPGPYLSFSHHHKEALRICHVHHSSGSFSRDPSLISGHAAPCSHHSSHSGLWDLLCAPYSVLLHNLHACCYSLHSVFFPPLFLLPFPLPSEPSSNIISLNTPPWHPDWVTSPLTGSLQYLACLLHCTDAAAPT